MKKIILLLTALALLMSMACCGQKAPVPRDPDTVTIVIPPELVGGETAKELKERYSDAGYLSVTLTEEGSAVLTMTKEKHAQLLEVTEQSIRESMDALAAAEDNRFTRIEADEKYTHYKVYLPSGELAVGEDFCAVSLMFSSGLYYVVLGQEAPAVTVDFVDERTGEVIRTFPAPAEG